MANSLSKLETVPGNIVYLPFTQKLIHHIYDFIPLPHPILFSNALILTVHSACLSPSDSLPSISELILDVMHFTPKHFTCVFPKPFSYIIIVQLLI